MDNLGTTELAGIIGLMGLVVVIAAALSGPMDRIGVPQAAIFLAFGALLGPGTLLTSLLISGAAVLLLELPLPAAMLLGAALGSTDPVMMRGLLRESGEDLVIVDARTDKSYDSSDARAWCGARSSRPRGRERCEPGAAAECVARRVLYLTA
ncbi:MAG: hypothetical protein NUW01_19175 [Gemmatimonadaceae bacterium]|nr:hypothetical protein [Gemmatimonadaceae bacterium]